jgi:hypothetical protein
MMASLGERQKRLCGLGGRIQEIRRNDEGERNEVVRGRTRRELTRE